MCDVIYIKLDIVYSIKYPIFWNSEIESDNFTVGNSEIIGFDYTKKSLQFIEKYIKENFLSWIYCKLPPHNRGMVT